MPTRDATLTRSLDDVSQRLDRGGNLYARIQCADGRNIEGEILDVGEAGLIVLDTRGVETPLLEHHILTLEISSPRRLREWVIAICAIPAVTALLVAFSRIPGVDPNRGDIMIGFMLVLAAVWALGRVPGLGKLWQGYLMSWDRVYPPRGA